MVTKLPECVRKINNKTVRNMLCLSHFKFKERLMEVAARMGRNVIETNEAYTSKTCPECGNIHKKLGSAKIFRCPTCGYEEDRDIHGSKNNLVRVLSY